jgi:hypothetical protein
MLTATWCRATFSWPGSDARTAIRWLSRCGVACLALGYAQAQQPPTAAGTGPAADFFALEERLLAADGMRFEFRVTAEGVIEADLQGALDIGPAADARLAASGTFDGQPVDLLLRTSGNQLELGNGTNVTRTATPAYLKEALVIGVTRMGVLHNLARLTAGAAPDHAAGGVRDWVTLGSFAADAGALSFDLTVAGEPAGSAALQVDSAGHPMLRRQTVEFPAGQMRVVERYSAFTTVE